MILTIMTSAVVRLKQPPQVSQNRMTLVPAVSEQERLSHVGNHTMNWCMNKEAWTSCIASAAWYGADCIVYYLLS